MKPQFINGNVRANCPTCKGAVTTFEHKVSGHELGHITQTLKDQFGSPIRDLVYHLVRCAGCARGGVAVVSRTASYVDGELVGFWPRTIEMLEVPDGVPADVKSEFGEAELCASVGAWRAGSSLLRSTLEKALLANGYDKGSLQQKIDTAAADGAITAARSKRAHENIRVLGNDVLHDEWRAVNQEEFDDAHHYAQRILEDFYDDRPTVEALLIEKGRIKPP